MAFLFMMTTEQSMASASEKQKKWAEAKQAADRFDDPEEGYRAAMTAYEEGRFHEAFTLVSRLFKQSPDSEQLNFSLGSTAYAVGKLSHASLAFERVLALNPDNQRAKLELARTYSAMGQFTLARQTFEEVLLTSPPPMVRDNVERYLDRIRSAQRKWKAGASAGAGVFFDDNVNVGPKAGNVRIQPVFFGPVVFDELAVSNESKPRESFGVFGLVHGSLDYDPGIRGRWSLVNNVTYYQTLLENNQNDFETIFVRATSGARHAGYRTRADIVGTYSYVERGNDKLVSTYGVDSVFTVAQSAQDRWTTSARVERRDYQSGIDSDSVYVEIGETYGHILENNPGTIRVGLAGFYEDAKGDQFDNLGVRASVGSSYSLPWKVQLSGRGAYQFSTYDEREALAPEEREDHQVRLGFGLNRPVTQNSNVSLEYNFTHNDSSFGLYEYDRNVVTLSVHHSL